MATPPPALTLQQRDIMAITERVVSCVSILGILFIILTYLLSDNFRRPINRLVFFASFGNLGMNLAALIAEDGPLAGSDSPLCQFQGFLVQMFLGVDAYWSLCMALNVYLIFFGHFDTKKLRKLDLRYIFCCYGLALVPSLVFLGISTDDGKVYGDAVLWCWIQDKWAVLRIGLVYSVSWIAIGFALAVYALAAIDVYKRRHQLRPGFMNPLNDAPLKCVITTEISVSVETPGGMPTAKNSSPSVGRTDSTRDKAFELNERGPANPLAGLRDLTRNAAEYHANTDAILYARAAFFYFIALLIIWVPASANRAYAVAHPEIMNFPLNYLSCMLLSGQGLLNVIVYMVTSREPMKELFRKSMIPKSSRESVSSEDEVAMVRRREAQPYLGARERQV